MARRALFLRDGGRRPKLVARAVKEREVDAAVGITLPGRLLGLKGLLMYPNWSPNMEEYSLTDRPGGKSRDSQLLAVAAGVLNVSSCAYHSSTSKNLCGSS